MCHRVRDIGRLVRSNTCSLDLNRFVEGGSLHSIIKKFGSLKEGLMARYMIQCLIGLDYLHRRDVVHRDIKA